MKQRTINALKKSIEHWERMASGNRKPGEAPGVRDCALCKLFWYQSKVCEGCPVSERTGLKTCDGSPYEDAAMAYEAFGSDSREFKTAARKELKFLKSLLPKTNKKGKA